MRPEALCEDHTPMLPVVKHAFVERPSDVIILLQPTSPFRAVEDIFKSYHLLLGTGGDAVVSVTEPSENLAFEVGHLGRMRESKNVVVANGALYLITADHLLGNGDWYNGVSYAYHMPKERSLDIDTLMDFNVAQAMLAQKEAA